MNIQALSFSNIFDSFKNNDYTTGSLTITGTIGAGLLASYSGTATLNRDDSVAQIYYSTSVNSDYNSTGNLYLFNSDTIIQHSNGSTPTLPGTATYSILFSVGFSGDTMTFTANILNPYANTLTVVTETVSFQAYTFIAPFPS